MMNIFFGDIPLDEEEIIGWHISFDRKSTPFDPLILETPIPAQNDKSTDYSALFGDGCGCGWGYRGSGNGFSYLVPT
jgi:hypothetical protein